MFCKFQSTFNKFFKASFLVALSTVDCKPATAVKRAFFEISRKTTFRNIPIHVLEISAKLQNAEIYTAALLKSVSITGSHPTISKIPGTLTGNFRSGVSLGTIIGGRIRQVELLKRNAT